MNRGERVAQRPSIRDGDDRGVVREKFAVRIDRSGVRSVKSDKLQNTHVNDCSVSGKQEHKQQ